MKRFLILIFLGINAFSFSQENQYFQQKVDYTIRVQLHDSAGILDAYETIKYTNNAPNALDTLYFHLWPNAYSGQNTALFEQFRTKGHYWRYYIDDKNLGNISSLNFKVQGKKIHWYLHSVHNDICILVLNEPLKASQTITITTPFKVNIPINYISRLGQRWETFQITQWYPKPAVYDHQGWHYFPYLDKGEFYSEFGTYDVYITLPVNYTVGATGDLVNGEKELERLDSLVEATAKIKDFPGYTRTPPPSSKTLKTLHFHQDSVHDFAWFADKKFHVLKGEVKLPHTGRTVKLWAMFTNYNAELWKRSIEYLHDAVYYYSLWLGDYPYNQVTAIQAPGAAGTGMEYPNITIIGGNSTPFSLENVIMHEVGHNWFYGILGSNEREHPWMDEGLNTFYENRYIQTKYPNKTIGNTYVPNLLQFADLDKVKYKQLYYLAYKLYAIDNFDQPMNLHSMDYDRGNYGMIVYSKSSAFFNYLMKSMGEKQFDSAMQEYYQSWKFKHPYPSDFENAFKKNAGNDPNWFFKEILSTNDKIDYKIAGLKRTENNYELKVKNRGRIASPVSIHKIKNDSIISGEWINGFEGSKIVNIEGSNFDKFVIDAHRDIPEINRQNNTIRRTGLLRKVEPLRFHPLWAVKDPAFTQLYGIPAIGWNYHDQFMAGAALYSNPLPKERFDYLVMPMYSFGRHELAGNVYFGQKFFPTIANIQFIEPRISLKQYGYIDDNRYYKFTPEFNVQFLPIKRVPLVTHSLKIRNVNINKEENRYDMLAETYRQIENSYSINSLTYQLDNQRAINPFSLGMLFEQNKQFGKASVEFTQEFNYKRNGKYITSRLFFGSFIYKDRLKEMDNDYRFRLSGWSGRHDYLFDEYFLGRNAPDDNFSHYQMAVRDGGFKVQTGLGQTWDWLGAMNIDIPFPGKIPVGIFADIGCFVNKESENLYTNPTFMYDAGAKLELIPGIFEVWFPALMSEDLKETSDFITGKYVEKIRFSLYLNKLNPLEELEKSMR